MNRFVKTAICAGVFVAGTQALPLKAAVSWNDLMGSVAQPFAEPVSRTIRIGPDTRLVNVKYGETVRFVTDAGQAFNWRFDGLSSRINLMEIAPQVNASRNPVIYVDHGLNPLTHPIG